MRALMNKLTLNELLSAYCGNQMTRNALVICHRISAFAQGGGPDRSRFHHCEEVAIPFRYILGQWWWGNVDELRWNPTLGPAASLPPLSYMDVGAIFAGAE